MGSMGNSLGRTEVKSSVDRLTTISKSIEENTQILTEKLYTQGLCAPSYERDGLADFPLKESDDETLKARQQILSLTKELRDLVLGPRESLKLMAMDVSGALFEQFFCVFTAGVLTMLGCQFYSITRHLHFQDCRSSPCYGVHLI